MCADLSGGKLPFSTLTCADVTLNRTLRGPCPHCAAGKHHNTPHPPSTSPSATSVGQVISIDPQLNPEPPPGQHTHEIILVDEFTRHVSAVGATSKTSPSVFKALQLVISTTYNANHHQVHTFHGDCVKIDTSLAALLGSLGIKLQKSPPGEHAARVEQYTLTIGQRSLATLSTLAYEVHASIPSTYTKPSLLSSTH